MLPKKYMSHYKCGCQKVNQCNCPRKMDISQIFMENINDIAESLAEVMIVCGIHPAKARATGPITVRAFLHYDEVRHRIDAVPKKHFSRECVFFLLGNKCLMTRIEAQLAYTIMKRAFKAFYHGTDVGGIRNPVLDAQLIHSSECFWVHAANRTAQIFAQYEGLFKCAEKYYASKIKCIYKKLYDRITERSNPIILDDCECPDCVKKIIRTQQEERAAQRNEKYSIVNLDDNSQEPRRSTAFKVDFTPSVVNPSTMTVNIPHCYKCDCPKLVCECDVQLATGILSAECSQGPFICRWVKDTEEEKFDPCILVPENHECPVDCYETGYECDSDCECDCDECECLSSDPISVYDDYDYTDKMSRILTEAEEESTVDTEPPAIDMTPMHKRKPHPAFDCCRVAPPPAKNVERESSQSLSESALFKAKKSRKHKKYSSKASKEPKKLSKQDRSVVENINEVIKGLF